jgi:hypothetical protein
MGLVASTQGNRILGVRGERLGEGLQVERRGVIADRKRHLAGGRLGAARLR